MNQQCVPDLFAASGATQWGNHDYPWLIGSELVPYPLEVKTFVDYLKKTQAQRDDRGARAPTTTSASRTPTRSSSS